MTKLQNFRPATLLKWESNANVFQWILRNFEEHLQAIASEKTKSQQIKAYACKRSTKI